jgi:TolB protein
MYRLLFVMAVIFLTACSLTEAPLAASPSPEATSTSDVPVAVPEQEPTTQPTELTGRLIYVENGDLHRWENGVTTQLTEDGRLSSPAWSPNGDQVAVVRRDEESLSNVYILDGNGENARQVTTVERTTPERSRDAVHEVVWTDGPAWRPDGSSLVYVSQVRPATMETADPPLYEYPLSIFEASLDEFDNDPPLSDVLFQASEADVQQPAWAPDESVLAYVEVPRDDDGQRQIRLYDPETDEGRSYPNMPTNVYDPVWSPDGEWLAFTGVVDGQTDVWVIKEPSGDDTPIRLTNTGAARAAAWSPDARTLAFVGIDEQGANLYALALESGENASLRAGDVQQLTTSGNVDANSRASWAE